MEKKPTPRAIALLPVAVFLVLYLVLGIILEYVLKIEMGFYQIPIVVAFLVALLVACLQNRGVSFDEKLELMGQGIGDKNIVTMILIFLVAGIFVVGAHSGQQSEHRALGVAAQGGQLLQQQGLSRLAQYLQQLHGFCHG